MMKRTRLWSVVALVASGLLGYGAATGRLGWAGRADAAPEDAKPATGAPPPGSPAATRRIDGNYLADPAPEFKGTINLHAVDSKAYWPATIVPAKGAANVLLIMADDVGFGAPSAFGGVIPTPNLERI